MLADNFILKSFIKILLNSGENQ